MKQVIFLSGLGADERLFSYINLNDCHKQFIKWVKPLKNETLESYLLKLKGQMTIKEPPVLVGVSLGGIMAMELRELIPVEKTIIISSIKTRDEMPFLLNLISLIKLNIIVPIWAIKMAGPVLKVILTGNTNKKSKQLFKQMVDDSDDDFLKWAMQIVLDWQRRSYNPNKLVHIHGTKDIVFPFRNIQHCDYTIKGGAHDMIMSKPVEINEILLKEIF